MTELLKASKEDESNGRCGVGKAFNVIRRTFFDSDGQVVGMWEFTFCGPCRVTIGGFIVVRHVSSEHEADALVMRAGGVRHEDGWYNGYVHGSLPLLGKHPLERDYSIVVNQ